MQQKDQFCALSEEDSPEITLPREKENQREAVKLGRESAKATLQMDVCCNFWLN
jgi:hypothetical protein